MCSKCYTETMYLSVRIKVSEHSYYVKFLCILLPVMVYNTYMIVKCNY